MRFCIRLSFFGLALSLYAAALYALALAQSPAAQNMNRVSTNTNTAVGNANVASFGNMSGNMNASGGVGAAGDAAGGDGWNENGAHDEALSTEPPTLAWTEVKPVWGYATTRSVTLRSDPNDSSNVIATLELAEYEGPEILDATRDHLRVRFRANAAEEGGTRTRDYEGWVEWGAVVPHSSAIVLDAGSGEVVGRVPVGGGVASVTFSPDGKRAIFYASVGGAGHEPSVTAFEVETDGFRRARALETSATGGFASIFYDPSGGDLVALAQQIDYRQRGFDSKFYPFRVGGERVEAAADAGSTSTHDGALAPAPGGAKGLLIHNTGAEGDRVNIDVVDLKTLGVINSFDIARGGSDGWPYEYAVGRDAAEFYYRNASGDRLVVVNTRTGERVREIPLRVPEDRWMGFAQDSLVGDSLLIRLWRTVGEESESDHAEVESDSFWLKPDGEMVAAARGVDFAVEANGSRYAVNGEGTLLFKLDGDGRVREKLKIERPETKYSKTVTKELSVLGLAASPDGKYLILFIGTVDDC